MISAANAAAARIEEANTETARLNAEATALKVETTLGGQAEAGTGNKEETPEEYAKKVMANENPDLKQITKRIRRLTCKRRT